MFFPSYYLRPAKYIRARAMDSLKRWKSTTWRGDGVSVSLGQLTKSSMDCKDSSSGRRTHGRSSFCLGFLISLCGVVVLEAGVEVVIICVEARKIVNWTREAKKEEQIKGSTKTKQNSGNVSLFCCPWSRTSKKHTFF